MNERVNVGVIDTEDVDEHREAVRPWDLKIGQISPGKYRARTEYVSLNGILVYREHCNRRLIVTGATPAGYLLLGSPSTAETRIEWCGGEIHSGRLAFGKSSTEVDIIVPEDSRHVVLLIREDLALKHLGEKLGWKVLVSEYHHLICHPSVGESFVQTVHQLVDRLLKHPQSRDDPGTCKAVESELMGFFCQAIDPMESGAGRVPGRERRLALQRAVKYAEDLRQPLGVAALATAAGVSRRALELAFRDFLKVSPLNDLKWSRMNGARRDLRAAAPDSARVKDIAARWGFSEAGRFAVEYGRLFGESPSETLGRNVRPLPMRLEDALRA